MTRYKVDASISDGKISKIVVTRTTISKSEDLVSFVLDDGVAEISRIYSNKTSRLLKAVEEVYDTEYVDEVFLTQTEGGTNIKLTEENVRNAIGG